MDNNDSTATATPVDSNTLFMTAVRQMLEEIVAKNMNTTSQKVFDSLRDMQKSLDDLSKTVDMKQPKLEKKMEDVLEDFFVKKHIERVQSFRSATQQKKMIAESKRKQDIEEDFNSDEIFYDFKNATPGPGFDEPIQKALDDIRAVIGQPHLKDHFEKLCYKRIKQTRLTELDPKGTYGPSSYHMVFRGNPGTGKTMVAGLVGKLLKALKIIPTDNFKVVQLQEMKAKYLGQTPHLLAETFKNPGVYFIDEAYSIMQRSDDSYGTEILAGLCEMLENRRHEIVVIMAGYKDDMIELFKHNAGLESRFHWIFDFHDYSQSDLVDIAQFTAKKSSHKFTSEAIFELGKDLTDGMNARDDRNFVEEIEFCQSVRTGKSSEYSLDFLQTFTVEDVLAAREQRRHINPDAKKFPKTTATQPATTKKSDTVTRLFAAVQNEFNGVD